MSPSGRIASRRRLSKRRCVSNGAGSHGEECGRADEDFRKSARIARRSHSRVGVAGSGISGFSRMVVTLEHVDTDRMDPDDRAELLWSRTAGLASRDRKDRAVDIIEAGIRSAQREALLEAAQLVLTNQPVVAIARQLREAACALMDPEGTRRSRNRR